MATTPEPIGSTFIGFFQRIPDGEVYLDLAFIAFRLALTSFFTNVIGIGFPFGKLTMAFVHRDQLLSFHQQLSPAPIWLAWLTRDD